MKLRTFCSILVVGVILLTGCAAAQPTATATGQPAAAPTSTKAPTVTPTQRPLTKVTITQASPESISLTLTVVAQSKGYWAQEGLDAEFVFSGSAAKSLTALAAGDAQFSNNIFSQVLTIASKGVPVIAIAAESYRATNNVTMRKDVADRLGVTEKTPFPEKVRALKGLKIAALGPGSETDRMMRFILTSHGLDPDRDVELVSISKPADTVPALKGGSVDAIVIAPPSSEVPIAEGYGIRFINVLGGEVLGLDFLHVVLATRRDYVDAHPDVALSAARVIAKVLKFVQQDRSGAQEEVRKINAQAGVESGVADLSFSAMSPAFSNDPVISMEAARKRLEFENTWAEEKMSVDLNKVVENRFAEQAKLELADWRP
ncbi:MAG: ABC transporter substrate-binding protein [Chloroflexi bacterium]|nr:ABC transporter substrate-binding protein [Chloroflexota bacterium]